ncbi:MAG: ABC transporter substrate-binding protein [Desulfobulbaceae bacterium]
MLTGTRSRLRPLLALLLFLVAPSQSLAELRVGAIMSGDIPYYREMHESFVRELHALLPAGEKVEIIPQRPFPDPIAWSNAARKLIALEVDLVVAYGEPAARAVEHEKSGVPLLYAGVYDPEHAGLKGKKMTGCGFKVPLSSLLRYFKQLKRVDSLTVVFSGIEDDSVRQKEELRALTATQHIQLKEIDIRVVADLDQLRSLNETDTVFVTGSALSHLWLAQILDILRQNKVPMGTIFPDSEGGGVLITLYQPPREQGKMAASMAARILRGEEPAAIDPAVQRDTELVFNLVQAQQLGITFPLQLIVEATRVIK